MAWINCLICGKPFAQNGGTSIVCPDHPRLSVEETWMALADNTGWRMAEAIDENRKAAEQLASESEA